MPRARLPLVGRRDEMAALDDEFARAAAGEFRVVMLSGEAGVGKSRLARELLARHPDPDGYMAALWSVDRGEQDPLGRSPLLHLELLMYAARTGQRGKEPGEFLRARRQLIADIVEGTGLTKSGSGLPDPGQLAAMLLAMEDGFRLHQLIDPDGTPPDSFLRSVSALQEAFRPAR